jgi:hypothetical protein
MDPLLQLGRAIQGIRTYQIVSRRYKAIQKLFSEVLGITADRIYAAVFTTAGRSLSPRLMKNRRIGTPPQVGIIIVKDPALAAGWTESATQELQESLTFDAFVICAPSSSGWCVVKIVERGDSGYAAAIKKSFPEAAVRRVRQKDEESSSGKRSPPPPSTSAV